MTFRYIRGCLVMWFARIMGVPVGLRQTLFKKEII